jgi:serine/threonine protein kinase
MHRDVKPSNMLIYKDNTLKLCDFGMARTADAQRGSCRQQPGDQQQQQQEQQLLLLPVTREISTVAFVSR